MSAAGGAGRPDLLWTVYVKRAGPYVSLAGVLLCGLLCGIGAQLLTEDGEFYRELEPAACWFGMLALCALGAGLCISSLPEYVHFGAAARQFARAERRHLGVGRWRWSAVLGLTVLLAGLAVMAYVVWGRSFSDNYRTRDYAEVLAVLSIIAAFAVSIFLPPITAAVSAVSMSASCRSGAAHDLLMGPVTANHLGWAAVRAHVLRGWMGLAVFLPLHAVTIFMFSIEVDNEACLPSALLFPIIMLAVVAIEMLFLAASAALGVWMGAAVPVPALAGALAGPVPVLLWLARLVVIAVCAATGHEMWSWEDRALRFWSWILMASTVSFVGPVFLGATMLRLLRSSLRLPFSVRLGAWMVRHGEAMTGLSGESLPEKRRDDEIALETDDIPRAGLWWKLGTVGVWVLAVLMLVLFGVAAVVDSEFRKVSADIGPRVFWIGYVLLAATGLGACFLGRFVARRVRETAAGMVRRRRTAAAR